jgi:thioredoxin-dependent peroxiredoxin
MSLKEGDKLPSFALPTDDGGEVSTKSLKGKKAVVYFYPKDNTPGCTKEACDFRDAQRAFKKAGIEVVGVSKDSVKSHAGFRDKQKLNFALGSDADGKVCDAFGTWIEKSLYGRKYMGIERATFLVDEKGVIRKIWHKVKVPGHVDEVLEAAKEL